MTDFRELTNRILIPLEKFYRGLTYFRAGEITNSGGSFVMFVVKIIIGHQHLKVVTNTNCLQVGDSNISHNIDMAIKYEWL